MDFFFGNRPFIHCPDTGEVKPGFEVVLAG